MLGTRGKLPVAFLRRKQFAGQRTAASFRKSNPDTTHRCLGDHRWTRSRVGCEGEAMDVDVLRYAAFTDDPASGNPAGIVPDAGQLTEQDMLGIAAEVGYSETAFITGSDPRRRRYTVRYFSPEPRGLMGMGRPSRREALAQLGQPSPCPEPAGS
jgi:hypothetical protein